MVVAEKPKLFAGIDKALSDGLALRAFTSGGGLRVVRIEVPDKERRGQLRAYGEHPHIREALMLASADYLAGGGTYETHYLTGSQNIADTLDGWLLGGHRFSARKESGNTRVEANSYDYTRAVVAVEAPTFSEAYSGLGKLIEPHHFDIANGFT